MTTKNDDVLRHLPKSYRSFYGICLDAGMDIMKKKDENLKKNCKMSKIQNGKDKKTQEQNFKKKIKTIQINLF